MPSKTFVKILRNCSVSKEVDILYITILITLLQNLIREFRNSLVEFFCLQSKVQIRKSLHYFRSSANCFLISAENPNKKQLSIFCGEHSVKN